MSERIDSPSDSTTTGRSDTEVERKHKRAPLFPGLQASAMFARKRFTFKKNAATRIPGTD